MTLLDRRRILTATALLAAITLSAAGCGTIPQSGGATAPGSGTRSTSPTSSSDPSQSTVEQSPTSTPTPDPVTFAPNVKDGAKNVKVSTVIGLKAANGTVGAVKLSVQGHRRQRQGDQG